MLDIQIKVMVMLLWLTSSSLSSSASSMIKEVYICFCIFVNPGLPVLLEDKPHPLDENIRRVERGSRIVVAVAQDTKIVLQVFHPTNKRCLDISFQSRHHCLGEEFPRVKCGTNMVEPALFHAMLFFF